MLLLWNSVRLQTMDQGSRSALCDGEGTLKPGCDGQPLKRLNACGHEASPAMTWTLLEAQLHDITSTPCGSRWSSQCPTEPTLAWRLSQQ